MAMRKFWRALPKIILFTIITAIGFWEPLLAQTTDELDAIDEQVESLTRAGKYAEAIETAGRSVALAENKFGIDHIRTARELYRLGNMMRYRQSQFAAAHPLLLRALTIFERSAAGHEDIEVARTLNELGWTSVYTLQLPEAQQFFSRSLSIKEKLLDPYDVEIAYTLDGLAITSTYVSQYDAAARHAARSLEIKRKRLKPTDVEIANSVALLATIKHRNGEVAEAEKLFYELLQAERAKSQPNVLTIADLVGLLAVTSMDKGDYDNAERQARESIAILERNGATERGTYFSCLNLMAKILAYTGRHLEAETSAKKVIQAYRVSSVVQARDVMDANNTLGIIFSSLDRYSEAEEALKRSLAIAEVTFGEESIDVSTELENLAALYNTLGRSTEAFGLFNRILRIRNNLLPVGHPLIGSTHVNRSLVLNGLSRYREAEADAREGIRILTAIYGESYPMALTARNELGSALKGQSRYADAVQVYRDAIAAATAAEGEKSVRIPVYVHNMGLALESAGRYGEAEDAYLQSIAAQHLDTLSEAQTRKVLGDLYIKMSRYREARENFRLAIAVFVEAFKKTAASRREYEGRIWLVSTASAYVSALLNSTDYTKAESQTAAREAFEVAQWLVRTSTSVTLSQLGARYAAATGELAQSVRARQDSIQRWVVLSGQLDRLISQPIGDRNQTQVMAARSELTKLETELTEIDQRLTNQFPAYSELSSPRPVTVDEVQNLLSPDEALVQIVLLDQRVLVWVVTPTDVAWYPLSPHLDDLSNSVASLRCGLDYEGAWAIAGSRCAVLLKNHYSREDYENGKPLPFDAARAHELYREVFGQAEGLIKNKNLLVVLSGPLTQLPLHVLIESLPVDVSSGKQVRQVALLGVEFKDLSDEARQQAQLPSHVGVIIAKLISGGPAELAGLQANDILLSIGRDSVSDVRQAVDIVHAQKPGSKVRVAVQRGGARIDLDVALEATQVREWQPLFLNAAAMRRAAWLARSHTITVLPAASSLKALRRYAKESHASESYIGFGNPLLDGEPTRFPDDVARANLARAKRCVPTLRQRVTSLFSFRGGTREIERSANGLSEIQEIRQWSPLPETADELCNVARDLGVDPSTHLYIGAKATEATIKHLSMNNLLARYKIVHFATHGALAGQVSSRPEPGLILTPPQTATETNDGYLTVSEISALKLDADWVILSACNTAAGGAKGAEALSGLARAFFYAGARSLLVSHWGVASDSTVKLVTKAIDNLRTDPKIGRAEAIRRSMLSLITTGKAYEAHPAFWAPFVLVGEGAAAR